MRRRGALTKTWWTPERTLRGLRRFHQEHGQAPTATSTYLRLVSTAARGPDRRYPSFAMVLRHFRTFRQAWTAAGVAVDRTHEDWTALEDWYVREAAGVLPRAVIAADLGRTRDAVHRRLYDLGLNSYTVHGWGLRRLAQEAGVSIYWLERAIQRGQLPARRGSKAWIVQPGDLVAVPQVDWTRVSADLAAAARQTWLARLAGVLATMSKQRKEQA